MEYKIYTDNKYQRISLNIISIVFFIGVSVNFLEIVIRIIFNNSIDLFFDIPVWITVWCMLLLGGLNYKRGDHVSVDYIREKATGKTLKFILVINCLLTIIFCLVIFAGGIAFVLDLYTLNLQFSRSYSVPKWIVMSCVPIGMFFFSLSAVKKLYDIIRNKY